jgi:hypothetical protein
MKAKANVRHHSARPVSAVKPNSAVNDKPNYAPVEKAAMPNVNPSLPGPVGVDGCDPDDPEDCDDRKKSSTTFVY